MLLLVMTALSKGSFAFFLLPEWEESEETALCPQWKSGSTEGLTVKSCRLMGPSDYSIGSLM